MSVSNFAVDAVARSNSQNMFCASIADNAENPSQNAAQAALTCTNGANTPIPDALFAEGTGLYYISYTVTASGQTQGGVGRVTKSNGVVTGSSGFGVAYFTSAAGASTTYLQLNVAANKPAINNATGANVIVSVVTSKIAA